MAGGGEGDADGVLEAEDIDVAVQVSTGENREPEREPDLGMDGDTSIRGCDLHSATTSVPMHRRERPDGRKNSLMREVRERIGMLVDAGGLTPRNGLSMSNKGQSPTPRCLETSPYKAAVSAVSARCPEDLETWSEDKDSFGMDVEPRCQIPFRGALVGAIVLAVLMACLGMFFPLDMVTRETRDTTLNLVDRAVMMQSNLINDLVFDNVTAVSYSSTLLSVSVMVEALMKMPLDRSVEGLELALRLERHLNASWTGTEPEQRMMLEHRSWLQLASQASRGVEVTVGRYTDSNPHTSNALWLYVGFAEEQFAGACIECREETVTSSAHLESNRIGDSSEVGMRRMYKLDSPGVPDPVMTAWATDPHGHRMEPPVTAWPYLPTQRPWYQVQVRASQRAASSTADLAAMRPRMMWSELYQFTNGATGLSLTAPVVPCGNYSCLDGVVAADTTLSSLNEDCFAQWEQVRELLASSNHRFPIGPDNSSVFIVNHLSSRAPEQEGYLVSAAHQDAFILYSSEGQNLTLTKAEESPQDIVRATARALKARFHTWNNYWAFDGPQLTAFRFSAGLNNADEEAFVECDPKLKHGPGSDCMQAGTLSLELDSETRWLVAVVLPAGAFSQTAAQTATDVEFMIQDLHEEWTEQMDSSRMYGILVFAGMVAFSCALALCLGFVTSQPLRRLGHLMRRLGELDFAHESAEFEELRTGERSYIREVGNLQRAFCRLSRGIEVFARFVPETVVRNVVRGDARATRLHVSRREVTIMFSDIKDFTTISEKLSQRDLLFVLTRYLSVMTRIVELFDGVVAEILGDGLLVYWNTPDEVEDHAARGCAAALAQQQAMDLLNEEFQRLALPQLAIRIGLHTGVVLSGNIGSEMKMKFGCMGDPVNLASRLEGLCKVYGVGVICSGQTHAQLPNGGFFCRKLDLVQVKGKQEPTTIYEVVARDCSDDLENERQMSEGIGSTSPMNMDGCPDLESGFSSKDQVHRLPPMRSSSDAVHEAIQGSTQALHSAQTVLWDPLRRFVTSGGMKFHRPCGSFVCCGSSAMHAGSPTSSKSSQHMPPESVTPARSGGQQTPTPEVAANWAGGSTSANTMVSSCNNRDIVTSDQREHVRLYESALRAYQAASFEEARAFLEVLLEQKPDDVAATRLLERTCHYMNAAEERSSWTGVVFMMDK